MSSSGCTYFLTLLWLMPRMSRLAMSPGNLVDSCLLARNRHFCFITTIVCLWRNGIMLNQSKNLMYVKAFIVSHSTCMLRLQTFAKYYGANDLFRFGVTLVFTYSEVLGSRKSFLIHFHHPSPIVSLSMNTSLELLYKFSSYSIWALSLTDAPDWHHFWVASAFDMA